MLKINAKVEDIPYSATGTSFKYQIWNEHTSTSCDVYDGSRFSSKIRQFVSWALSSLSFHDWGKEKEKGKTYKVTIINGDSVLQQREDYIWKTSSWDRTVKCRKDSFRRKNKWG